MNKGFLLIIVSFILFSCDKPVHKKSNSEIVKLENKENGEDSVKRVKCENPLSLLITSDTLNEINIDSAFSLNDYFNLKREYSTIGRVILRVDDLRLTIDCTPRKSHSGLFYDQQMINVWKLSDIKFGIELSESDSTKKNNYISNHIKKESFNFFSSYKSIKRGKESNEIESPEFWVLVNRDIEIKNLKALIKSSVEGYFEAINARLRKPICKLTDYELDVLKNEKPFHLRVFVEK